jgi:hypothetical protein
MFYAIRVRAQEDYWERSPAQILLERQIPIHGHERIALTGEAIQQFTVINV